MLIINVFNEKIVNNKIYVYSCEGGSYGSLLRENPLHPERFDEKIMLDQKYNNYFKDTDELSLAEAIAFKCKNVNVEALANDEVDYYNVEIYPLNTDNSWISTYFNSLFFTYNILLNINDYYNIYYPKRHFEVYDNFSWMDYDGKWLEVKHDGEKFITNIIGRDWKL